MARNNAYTEGPIGSVMVKTALSMLPGTLAISGYNIVDTYFVSKLGTTPMAAMGFTFPIVMLVGCLYRGLDNGIMTPTAQLLGGRKLPRAARMVSSGAIMLILVSIAVGIIGSLTIDPVFRILLKANEETMTDIRSYMIIWYMGSVTAALGMASNALLVTAGESRLAGMFMLGGLLLNLLLDPIFIFGWWFFPRMGVAGAALATVIAQVAGLAATASVLHYKLRLISRFNLPGEIIFGHWKTILRYGIPAICAMLLIPLGSMAITRAVAEVGKEVAVAATAAAGRIEIVAFVFPMSLGMALLPMIGQNYGAKAWERINQCRRFSMRFAGAVLLLMATVFTIFAPQLSRLFTRDPQVLDIMVTYLSIVSWGLAGVEIHRFGGFFLNGCARPTAAALLNGSRVVVFLIPLTFLAVSFDSLTGIFYARLVSDICSGIAGIICARVVTRALFKNTPVKTAEAE